MIKSKLLEPYDKNGNCVFIKKTYGVYLIYKDKVLRYVGFSKTNVYKTLYRHFQKWDVSVQARTTYKNLKDIKVIVIYTDTPQQAYDLEKAIIIKKNPKDNPNKYLQYTTDKKEDKVYNLYTGSKVTDIITNQKYNDNEPF